MVKQNKKQQHLSWSGYEADDEGHGSTLISPSFFRIATFINPFDHPCDRSLLASTDNSERYMEFRDTHIVNTNPEAEPVLCPPLKLIQPNGIDQNSSRFLQKLNHNPKKIMQQENHEDGDRTSLKNNGFRGKPPRNNSVTKRNKKFIGVHYYRRTKRWEAYMWLNQLERQLWFGQHFIPEAAARTSDKAQLVLRRDFETRLNYTQDDYDMDLIQEWKELDLEDLGKILREQAKDYSEGCTVGLKKTAANLLRHQISEFRKLIGGNQMI